MQVDTFTFFARFIEKELGIVYSDFNKYQLENRLVEIVKQLGLKDVAELKLKASTNPSPAMKQLILDVATNNETSFFRDPKLFKVVAEKMYPVFAGKPLRIWSAACSSGQEPLTLAMIHLEHPIASQFSIVATDVSTSVLKRASDSRYSPLEAARGLSPALIDRYFSKDSDGQYVAKASIKSLMRFQQVNLLDSLVHLEKFDIIFCRNVLIYQSVENKRLVIEKLQQRLNPGGLLIMGAGESLLGLSEAFTTETVDGAVFYRLQNAPARAA